MLLKNNYSDFFRRLRFYILGFLLGLISVSILFKGRGGCKMPGRLKADELSKQKTEYTQHALCRMNCRNINETEVVQVLKTGAINYSKSNAQDKPYPTYAIEGYSNDGQNIRIVVADCDTISKIVTAIDLDLKKETCDCK